jgi:cytoskeletal protein RodZ
MSSFGEEIRRERELREISLQEVAQATKINVRYLEALEGNNFEHLPGGVFNRGFVRAYAEFIGIDPEGMVNAYLLEEQAQSSHGKSRDRGMLRRQPKPAADAAPAAEAGVPRPSSHRLWWIVVGLVALGLLIWAGFALVGGGAPEADGAGRQQTQREITSG